MSDSQGSSPPPRPDDTSADDRAADDDGPDEDADNAGEKAEDRRPPARLEVPVEVAAFRPPYGFLIGVSAVSLVLDLGSKWWAMENLQPTPERPLGRLVVIEGLLHLVYAQNRGGAWGVLQDQHDWLRIPFFLLISVLAIGFILSMYKKLTRDQWALRWGLPLVLGGAAGNLIDRLRYGHVVDFIDVFVKIDGKTEHWPTFNIADIAIVVGVILMGVDMFTSRKSAPAKTALRAPR